MADLGTIRILIADDFKELRDRIRLKLEQAGDIDLVGEAADLDEALVIARNMQPDIIVMNDYLPPIDSAHATAFFQRQGIPSSILVLSTTIEYYLIFRCFLYGVKGFMHKDEMEDLLLEAVRTIYQGSLYFSPKVRKVYGAPG